MGVASRGPKARDVDNEPSSVPKEEALLVASEAAHQDNLYAKSAWCYQQAVSTEASDRYRPRCILACLL